MLVTPNWVPGVHDKVPLIIDGAMPLLNPRSNTVIPRGKQIILTRRVLIMSLAVFRLFYLSFKQGNVK